MMLATDVTAPWLEAMQDRYPIVRYFSANDLAAQNPTLPKPDYLAPAAIRNATLQNWYSRWQPECLQEAKESRERLNSGRREVDVEVGE